MTQPDRYGPALRSAAAVAKFIQGEVLVVADACVVLAEAGLPLSPEAEDVAVSAGVTSGLIVVPYAVDEIMLVTQTCDLQFTTADEHRCLVAPVVRVSEQRAHEAERGRRPSMAALPWIDSTSVADLTRITTVERSVLASAASRGSPRTPSERLHLAGAISRFLTRPALPDDVNEVLRPFVARIQKKHDRQSAEGRCAHMVSELRLEAAPDLDHAAPALTVLLILDEEKLPSLATGVEVDNERVDNLVADGGTAAAEAVHSARSGLELREAWTALAECWLQPTAERAPQVAGVSTVAIEVLNGEELSYARSLSAPILDLRFLSTRAA